MSLGKRDGIVFALLAVIVFVAYARAFDRYFTSEDFLLLRILMEKPVWHDLPELVSTPWLSIAIAGFYRPLSTLMLNAEVAFFGTHHQYYNVAHVLVHILNALLVYFVARLFVERDGSDARLPATVAAVIFALYPLHPNAVIFIASFATLFGASFFLVSILCYLVHYRSGSTLALMASLFGFLAALVSYESAVVLPAVPMAHAVLAGSAGLRSIATRAHLFLASVYVAPVAGYFLLRKAVLGVFIGGYEGQVEGGFYPALLEVPRQLAMSIIYLLFPNFPTTVIPVIPRFAAASAILALLGGSAAYCIWRWLKGERRYALACLVAGAWVLSSFAPFGFAAVAPLHGRYWYMASVGLALYLSFLTALLLSSAAWRRAGLLLLAACFAAYYGALVKQNLGHYLRTGATARNFQAQTRKLPERGSESEHVFVGDYPRVLRDAQGRPLSYSLEWSLNEAVNPPFVDRSLAVYPLPEIHGEVPLAIAASYPNASVYAWDASRTLLRKLDMDPALALLSASPPRIEVFYPPDGGEIQLTEKDVRVDFRPPDEFHDLRLIVSGMSRQLALRFSVEDGATRHSKYFPLWVADLSHRVHPGNPIYYWVEARDAQRNVVAFSEMRSFFVRK